MNHTQRSPKSPVISSGSGQVWNQSSSSTSKSSSGSTYGLKKDQEQPKHKKDGSFFGFITRVFTCSGHIVADDEDPAPTATVQSFTHTSVVSNKTLEHSVSTTSSKASEATQGTDELSFQDICKATGNFSAANIIGEGGFGVVYKGTLKNGTVVAVKRAKKTNYDIGTPMEFKNEILTLSKIEHLNLVRYYGYIEHGDERIILVEYVSNGNLREHLDGKRGNGLEIGERLDIMIDALQRLKGGEVVLAMDPKLRRNPASMMVIEKVLRLARQCVAPTKQYRPSMKKCAEILWKIRKDYHEHNDVMAAANHSVQVPEIDARKNRREFFGIEDDSSNQ
ncbi:hypothetical protein M8C21_000980, partial [Ambrosia artemisiifolia]